MKARPRGIEREAAKWLSRFLSLYGFDPVECIPVLGRTGPNLTIEPNTGLVVDVKSRIKIPQSYILKPGKKCLFGQTEGLLKSSPGTFGAETIGARLGEMEHLVEYGAATPICPASRQVDRWLAHMGEWTRENYPEGIPILILHWPGNYVRTSTVVLYNED